MDIIKIIKDLRNLKIFIKSKLLDEETSNLIKYSDKNIIPIDSSSEEESSPSSASVISSHADASQTRNTQQ